MNDSKYVVINSICFLLMSSGCVMGMNSSCIRYKKTYEEQLALQAMADIRQDLQDQSFRNSMESPDPLTCVKINESRKAALQETLDGCTLKQSRVLVHGFSELQVRQSLNQFTLQIKKEQEIAKKILKLQGLCDQYPCINNIADRQDKKAFINELFKSTFSLIPKRSDNPHYRRLYNKIESMYDDFFILVDAENLQVGKDVEEALSTVLQKINDLCVQCDQCKNAQEKLKVLSKFSGIMESATACIPQKIFQTERQALLVDAIANAGKRLIAMNEACK